MYKDSDNVAFSSDEISLLSGNLNNINIGHVNFDVDDPETIVHVRLMAWHNRLNNVKHLKKNIRKELMSVACVIVYFMAFQQ